MALREFWCWYFKINERRDLLKKIEENTRNHEQSKWENYSADRKSASIRRNAQRIFCYPDVRHINTCRKYREYISKFLNSRKSYCFLLSPKLRCIRDMGQKDERKRTEMDKRISFGRNRLLCCSDTIHSSFNSKKSARGSGMDSVHRQHNPYTHFYGFFIWTVYRAAAHSWFNYFLAKRKSYKMSHLSPMSHNSSC